MTMNAEQLREIAKWLNSDSKDEGPDIPLLSDIFYGYADALEKLKVAEGLLDSRAGKLLKKGKYFLVVAIDEPYFLDVYTLIRNEEISKGRWTYDDQARFDAALAAIRGKP